MQNKLNLLPVFFRNLIYDEETNYIKLLIIVVLIAAILAFFHGVIKENMINTTSIVVIIITIFGSYIYFKKQYSSKVKYLQNKINKNNQRTILDKLCTKISESDNNNSICKNY